MRITVAALLVGAALALTGCQGATTDAPSPVRSTDLTSSDGGFDRNAVVGVVLPAGDDVLAAGLRDGLDAAGFVPELRTAPESGAVAAQRRAVEELVRDGAKALLVRAVDAGSLTGAVRTAHDAGVVVVSLGEPVPASGTGGDGVSADHRVRVSDDAAVTARRTVDVVRSLQRGRQPDPADVAD